MYGQWYHFRVSSRAGYVLVGGNSSRMGRNKALLPYHGRTLSEAVAETLHRLTGQATLVGGSRDTEWVRFGFVSDLYPGEGPLGGILTALRHSTSDWNLIAACDMPCLREDFLRQLLTIAEAGDADAVIPTGPSGKWEPLCAAYHRRCLQPLTDAFAQGVRKITTALTAVRVTVWQVPEELACFQNVNTPEDWAAYER